LKIAQLELDPHSRSATGVRGRAIRRFLESAGYAVDVLAPPKGIAVSFARQRYSLTSRLKRRLLRRKSLPHFWDYVADHLQPLLRGTQYGAIIGRGQAAAYVLTRSSATAGLRVLDLANVEFLEEYYGARPNLADVEETYEREMVLFSTVDVVCSPHEILTNYLKTSLAGLKEKLITVRLGTDPPNASAQYAFPPRIVYAGSYGSIQDPYLLATLAQASPFVIDCYGNRDPNAAFLPGRLSYQGYQRDLRFLANYQFGLITVSRDILRQHSPSTKFADYFAHGLPVLFPEWMKEGYTYPDCAIPYSERSFVEKLREVTTRGAWERMSRTARTVGETLRWDLVLKPLSEILGRQDK
jgi:hypothetical protein